MTWSDIILSSAGQLNDTAEGSVTMSGLPTTGPTATPTAVSDETNITQPRQRFGSVPRGASAVPTASFVMDMSSASVTGPSGSTNPSQDNASSNDVRQSGENYAKY